MGAHFLIDKDGTIYQTASVKSQTWHVGMLKARCLVTMTCSAPDAKLFSKWNPDAQHRREITKSIPARYPSNADSLGIELVGQALPLKTKDQDKRIFETVTPQQNTSLKWLVDELRATLGIPLTEVFATPMYLGRTRPKRVRRIGNEKNCSSSLCISGHGLSGAGASGRWYNAAYYTIADN